MRQANRTARVRPVMNYHATTVRPGLLGFAAAGGSGAGGHRGSGPARRPSGHARHQRVHHRRADHGVGLGSVPGDDHARPIRLHLGAFGAAAAGDHRARHRAARRGAVRSVASAAGFDQSVHQYRGLPALSSGTAAHAGKLRRAAIRWDCNPSATSICRCPAKPIRMALNSPTAGERFRRYVVMTPFGRNAYWEMIA